jgi:hypothetical protein
MDSAAMMKAWEDFRTPGEMHQLLASWNGQWTAEVSSWIDPAQAPVKSQATNLLNPIMSGLYQVGHLSGTMMGMHFEGRSVTGYDNAKKIFVTTWIDNLGSGIIMMTGPGTKLQRHSIIVEPKRTPSPARTARSAKNSR